MAYQSDMRRDEILNLVWDRVDFKEGLIRLKAEDTKTKEGRLIPLTPELTVLLQSLYKVRYLQEPQVFLVRGSPFNPSRRPSMQPVEGRRLLDSGSTIFVTRR
jgi:integrase